MSSGLDGALGRLRLACAALNLAVIFLAGALAWSFAGAGHPWLSGGSALLAAVVLLTLPRW
jgi:hypothetical protein